jgi:hypothetical protein
MHRDHNRPPRLSKQPGTNTISAEIPVAKIYQEPRSTLQGGHRPRPWFLEFEARRSLGRDAFTGLITNDDPYRHIRVQFPDRDSAIGFAERQGWNYRVSQTSTLHHVGPKVDELYRGSDALKLVDTMVRRGNRFPGTGCIEARKPASGPSAKRSSTL